MKPVRRVSVFESSCKVGKISSFIALLALLWLCPAHVIAQTETATISGQVTDASQAPVPNAPVVIRNEQTAQEFSVKTGENGNYVSPPLRVSSKYSCGTLIELE